LHAAIAGHPWLSGIAGDARRVSAVATYANYQLISERGVGPGWVMVGDAFGFVDPMLSPGVFLALRSAELVADALAPLARRRATASPNELATALASYATVQYGMLAAWMDLIAYFYDGRMVALFRAGRDWLGRGSALRTAAQNHIERHIALQATGTATTSRYSRGLLRLLSRHGLRGVDPVPLAIR
jgi:flavin-dependent dehydrogenase